jgi:hypothetical protein
VQIDIRPFLQKHILSTCTVITSSSLIQQTPNFASSVFARVSTEYHPFSWWLRRPLLENQALGKTIIKATERPMRFTNDTLCFSCNSPASSSPFAFEPLLNFQHAAAALHQLNCRMGNAGEDLSRCYLKQVYYRAFLLLNTWSSPPSTPPFK